MLLSVITVFIYLFVVSSVCVWDSHSHLWMFISKYFCLVFHALCIISITGCQTSFSVAENCKLRWFSDPSSTSTYSALQVTENMQVNIRHSDKIHTQLLIFFSILFSPECVKLLDTEKCILDYFGSLQAT
jgi:hypothetical protein